MKRAVGAWTVVVFVVVAIQFAIGAEGVGRGVAPLWLAGYVMIALLAGVRALGQRSHAAVVSISAALAFGGIVFAVWIAGFLERSDLARRETNQPERLTTETTDSAYVPSPTRTARPVPTSSAPLFEPTKTYGNLLGQAAPTATKPPLMLQTFVEPPTLTPDPQRALEEYYGVGSLTNEPAQLGEACAEFNAYEWAQTVYDFDPDRYAALDADGDGIACPELPNGAAPALWTYSVPEGAEPAELVQVIDGDTIDARLADGTVERVRLAMLSTPETLDPDRAPECFGAEATAFAVFLFSLGGDLYLERDVSERDRYDRLVRYAWLDLGDAEVYLVNEAMVRSGYGKLSVIRPDVRYESMLRGAQDFAKRHDLGLWSACEGLPSAQVAPVPTESPPLAPAPQPQPAAPPLAPAPVLSSCDPAYTNYCIPPAWEVGDLSCEALQAQGIYNVALADPFNDPHGLDGWDYVDDGVGCEPYWGP